MTAGSVLLVCGGALPLFFNFLVNAERCPTEGEVRLADGATVNEGRVEICLGRMWGTVCDHNWGTADAHVVCTQLRVYAVAEHAEALYRYGGGSDTMHYSGFHCSGSETRLEHCEVDRNSSLFERINCIRTEDAGVRCTNVPCTENTVSLNGQNVQVCHNQQWGLVCETCKSWNSEAAEVVCNQVGIPSLNSYTAFIKGVSQVSMMHL